MSRSINEMTLQEHRVLTAYVDAIARRDPCVQLGLVDPDAARQSLRRRFDQGLRVASATQLTPNEAFVAALREL